MKFQILEEALEVHDTLNPAIWEGNVIRPEVKDALMNIVNKYVEESEVLKIEDVIDAEVLGSNASYNYNADSDLDLHLVVNMERISSDPTLVQIACNAEKALFNKAYDITIHGVEVELYVEDVKTGAVSNGVYSLFKEEWIKVPIRKQIPDMSSDVDYQKLLEIWTNEATAVLQSTDRQEVSSFIDELYNLRRLSIMSEGEYAKGNIVFKEIRNSGMLQLLKDHLLKLSSAELSLEHLTK